MNTAVLLSGGVDSAVALHLLHAGGRRDLTAFYLKIWLEDELAFLGDCPWEDDLKYARQVCADLNVRLEIVPLQAEYFERVVEHAIAELRAGRTPSPDILCNERIKFGVFGERIGPEFARVASGHYARVVRDGGVRLLRAPDPVKDQTYFLARLSRTQLARAEFPLGRLFKAEVRRLAEQLQLPNRNRPDSQGICFLGRIRYNDFVRFHLGEKPGAIIDRDTGRQLGEHDGYWFFTIGQRQGLGLGGGPWYVCGKDVETNVVFVSHQRELAVYARAVFELADMHWIAGVPSRGRLLTKLRHGPVLTGCNVEPLADGHCRVTLDRPDTGVAAGQSAVLYDDRTCLGCGVIV